MVENCTKIIEIETANGYAMANIYLTENFMMTQRGYENKELQVIVDFSSKYSFKIVGEDKKNVDELEKKLKEFNIN